MTPLRPTIPVSVPAPAAEGGAGFAGDVTATHGAGLPATLDTQPDARGPRSCAGGTDETPARSGTGTTDVTGTAAPAANGGCRHSGRGSRRHDQTVSRSATAKNNNKKDKRRPRIRRRNDANPSRRR